MYDILIVGGGASGLFCAVNAALTNPNLKIAIAEKNTRVGKKLLITGNGRCNLSNIKMSADNFNSDDLTFVNSVISSYSLDKTLESFKKLGVFPYIESEKIYPSSLQASSVVDVLRYKLDELGVDLITEFDVKNIFKNKKYFELTSYSGTKLTSKKVVISTGGKSAPSTGSTGDGYEILKRFGHKITKLYPSLVQLVSTSKNMLALKGVKFNGSAELIVNGKIIDKEYGEILFTDYGLSGPPIFQISRKISPLINTQNNIVCKLDLMPQLSYEELLTHINSRNKNIIVDEFLTGLFNKQISRLILKEAGIQKFGVTADILTDTILEKISYIAKNWCFEIKGTMSWNNAQITIGGILTDEINPKTMESKIISDLYITGEIINVDGKCGGYNLQWAWSSGAIAGISVAKSFKE